MTPQPRTRRGGKRGWRLLFFICLPNGPKTASTLRGAKSLYDYTSKAHTPIDLRVPRKAFWSEAVSDPSRELVSFYSDTGPDSRGRFLREIQNWSDGELEL